MPRPTIVLDESCALLLDRVTALAPTFVFKRRGGFRSDPDRAALELYEVLSQQGIPPPYLLVAASFAGFTTILFAQQFPALVHGLVLVDSSHPRQSAVTLAALPDNLPTKPEIEAFRTLLHGFGPVWERSCSLLSEVNSLGDIPLIALAAGAPEMPGSLPTEVKQNLIQGWHALQREHANLSSRGQLRIVPGIGHAIAVQAPGVVVTAIVDLLHECPAKPGATGSRDEGKSS